VLLTDGDKLLIHIEYNNLLSKYNIRGCNKSTNNIALFLKVLYDVITVIIVTINAMNAKISKK